MRFDGRAVIVTGGSSGFGRAAALRFLREGAKVLIADLDEGGGQTTLEMAREIGGEMQLIVGDIATEAGAAAAARHAMDQFGTVNVLVNNAGIAPPERTDSWNAPEESWDRMLRINLKSVYLCSRSVIPTMIENGGGAIVNVASIAATRTCSCASYAAAKSGILGYTLQVATELAARNVRVNSVSPGIMLTPMLTGERKGFTPEQTRVRLEESAQRVPMKRVGSVEDIAAAIAYLASDDARYVTGQELIVDGGYVRA